MHVQQYNISDYEIGRIEPNIPQLIRLAEIFNVSLDFLLGRKVKDTQIDPDEEEIKKEEERNKLKEENKYLLEISDAIENLTEDEKKQVAKTVKFLVKTYTE